MKNSTLIPLFAVTAAAAFGLGWAVHPDSAKEEADASSRSENSRANRQTSSGRSGRGSDSPEGPEGAFLARYLVNGEISGDDMRAAIKEIAEMNDPLMKQKMFSLLLENLTADNAKDAFLALKENRGGGRFGRGNDDQLRLLANAWGRIDGPGAIAALKEIAAESDDEENGGGRGGRGGRGPDEMSSVLAGWATVDGAAASAYVSGIEDERELRSAAYGVIQGMLVNGVEEAMGFISSLPATDDGDRSKGMFMAMVTGEMLEQGLDQAKSWADTVTDPDLRTGVLARVTMEIMQDDPAGAAEWIANYGDEDAAAPAVSRLADSWAREDPQAVMDWAENLSGKSKAEAYQETMESWARQDPAAAGEYLTGMEASPERDAAVEGYATRVSRENPETAMEWAETISDQGIRQEAMVEVARDWMRNDRAAAEQWVQASGLPAEAIESISETRGGGGGGRDGGGRGGRGR